MTRLVPFALLPLLLAPFAATTTAMAQATPVPPGCEFALSPRQPAEVTAEVRELVEEMTTEQKVGQLLMAGVLGTELGDDEAALIRDGRLGNVILMGRNVDDPAQVLALTQALQREATRANGVGMLIATDQEGGLVQRLNSVSGFTPLPDAATAGLAECPRVLHAYGRMMGEEMAAVGVNMAMAPVLDTNLNPDNPVIGQLGRAWATTPEGVVADTLPVIAGLQEGGVLATGKHFPGHGSTTTDSHQELPVVEKSRAALMSEDVVPFAAATAAGIDAIMPAHVLYPALDPEDRPATVSPPIQTGLLREELGFAGLIVTDDMGMKGITSRYTPEESGVAAVLAGADLVLCVRMPSDTSCTPEMFDRIRQGLLDAVGDGRISPERLDASVERVVAAKLAHDVGPASGDALPTVKGAAHLRILAELYDAVADHQAANGKP
jgi:beta-N-acetylhexosaminidase